ncbi:MAG: GntR family transcriptional regulator [Rhodospirillales bacterium]|nr:GntR family transcriptional regulator [Rhodospirillales bacterium]
MRSGISSAPGKPSLREVAYDKFKDALFAGIIRPGQMLSQREICELIDVPLGPLREALKGLENDGIVTLLAKRGVQVISVDEKMLNDAYDFRILIEGQAVAKFANEGPMETIKAIKKRTEEFVGKFKKSDPNDPAIFREKLEVDFMLHDTIMEFMGNPLMTRAFQQSSEQMRLFRLNIAKSQGYFDLPSLDEHMDILRALEKRDGKAAAKAMAKHLNGARERAIGQ